MPRTHDRVRSGRRWSCALALTFAVTGCDLMDWIPSSTARPHTLTAFQLVSGENPRLHATATVELGALEQRFTRLILKSRCTMAGQPYIDSAWLPLVPPKRYSNTTVAIDELPFSGKTWDAGIVEGDCDLWVSLRERGERTGPYEETLLGSRCHRDGVWSDKGCAPLPGRAEPDPLGAASVDLKVHSFEFRTTRKGRHKLRFKVEYGVRHAVHPDWDLEAEATCSAGSETVSYAKDINGPHLFELRPGERARGFLYASGSVKTTLSVPAEHCEVTLRAEKSRGEGTVEFATFCLEPGKDAQAGRCTPG